MASSRIIGVGRVTGKVALTAAAPVPLGRCGGLRSGERRATKSPLLLLFVGEQGLGLTGNRGNPRNVLVTGTMGRPSLPAHHVSPRRSDQLRKALLGEPGLVRSEEHTSELPS